MKIAGIFCLLILTFNSFGAEDVSYPGFLKKINALGINELIFDNDSSMKLEGYISNTLSIVLNKKENDPNADKDELKEFEAFFKMASQYHQKAKNEQDSDQALRYYTMALRMIYSIESSTQPTVPHFELNDIPGLIRRLDSHVPYVNLVNRFSPIGVEQAKKEARNLVDPITGKFITRDQLAKMSHFEVSKLDVSTEHPAWVTQKYKQGHEDIWDTIEKWTQKKQVKALKKKILKKLKIDGLEALNLDPYKMHQARKVLFIHKIKSSATSPKINTKDAYGEKWKLKWGNEVQTEPFANRMITSLGAKFADLVYVNKPGIDGVVLILAKKDTVGDCKKINTIKLFKTCLKSSRYKFMAEPYILNSGIITEENSNEILKNLARSGLNKYAKENLIGRDYITFKESMSEFKSKRIMTRAGAPAGSFLGAREDRTARAYLMIAAFLYNIDQKDINNKAVIAKDLFGEKKVYLEYTHDLGASLGRPGESLKVNGLSYGKDFMRRSLMDRNKIIIRQLMIYRPKAWSKITFADAMWMTRKILALTKSDFESFAQSTLWPEYMQRALVQMMRLRRNQMAEVFKMKDELAANERNIRPLIIFRDLSTLVKREAVAKEYNLELSMIEEVMMKNNLLDKDGSSDYIDYLVKKNKIVGCKRSIITNLLEKIHHPSGLERRQRRSRDNKPLSNCLFRRF